MTRILKIARETNWIGKFRLEYDGKYITLFGEDKDYPGWGYGSTEKEPWFEEMCLAGSIAEGRNLTPEIVEVNDKEILIDIGDDRETLGWCELNSEGFFEAFEF